MCPGMVCGAESISNMVEERLAQRLREDYPNRTWVLDSFRRQFDECYKIYFGEDDSPTYPFQVPGSNFDIELSR